MMELVDRCYLPGQTVLDPMMGGGGTMGIVCRQTYRKGVGIELRQ